MPPMTVTIRWMSALPIKHAVLRQRMGKEAESSPQAKEFLERQETHYVVAVIMPFRGGGAGFGGRQGRPDEGTQEEVNPEERRKRMADRLKEVTALKRKGKEPIRPERIEPPQQDQNSFLFLFPKKEALTVEDKEVEFVTKVGQFDISRKFKLKDMVYQGQLAL